MADPYFQTDIAIEPLPKERPRLNRKTGTIYTPTPTRNYEKALADAFRAAGAIPNETDDLYVVIEARLGGKKRKDLDNLVKSALDAGNGVLFKDDAQVCTIVADAFYEHDRPGLSIAVGVIDGGAYENVRSAAGQ